MKPPRYVELRAASAFSFLAGASAPEELAARAAELELEAVALADVAGLYGAPRFHGACKAAGLRALVGAEVVLDDPVLALAATSRAAGAAAPAARRGRRGPRAPRLAPAATLPRVTLLVRDRAGYRNLCRLLTAGALGRPKGEGRVSWTDLEAHAAGLHCLTGGAASPFERALAARDPERARRVLERLASIYPGRVHVELSRHGVRAEAHRGRVALALARATGTPVVATNGVRHARAAEKELLDVLTCIAHGTHLDAAGRLLEPNRERHLKPAAAMARLFADLPEALHAAGELADALEFTLADLGYRFPDYPLPAGETASSYLRQLTWSGARARFRPLTARAQAQLRHELDVIEKLDLAGYFLIVWDIVRFCFERRILVQGRGSAANSAVCYALSITAVDPVKMGLLFERFLSEERGEWPDIDLDLPSGAEREQVIQHVYARYGPHGAAMTANVISYRDRSAAREVAKALGYAPDQVERLARRLGHHHFGEIREAIESLPAELEAAGLDAREPRARAFIRHWAGIHHLPRHLGQHSGGMVIAAGRLDEVVPLEPASMAGRVVVQWDKEDCADLGIIKVDLLGLGMLAALEEAVPLVARHEGVHVDLAHLPPDDPKVYAMLRAADTVGVFQVESRAQMASLPRNAPERFYDLVVQVAIIRPGPIVGGMVHPYFERRRGRERVVYPHPCLEPILERTLGVPIFQEQVLRMAMTAAGFTGGEAEELRRAMGFKRSIERMEAIHARLRRGMAERGIGAEAQELILHLITSFAMYGFPESHAASFALIAYASAYLKAHHPAAFYVALLNAWPMGFYAPATLIRDAERHGVGARPIDVTRSAWACTWEEGAIRVGLRYVKGLTADTGARLESCRAESPFADLGDLERRVRPKRDELDALARTGALAGLGLERRAALWQVAEIARRAGPLLERLPPTVRSPLREMSPAERSVADHRGTGLTTGPHFMSFVRPRLGGLDIHTCHAAIHRVAHGRRVRVAGHVIVRQRPGTAKGFVFLTLEDETGMAQAIVRPDLFGAERSLIVSSSALVVEGVVERRDGTCSIKAERVWPLDEQVEVRAKSFC